MAEPASDPLAPPTGNVEPAHDASTAAERQPRRGRALPWLLVIIILAFALGLIANPWFEANIRSHLPSPFHDAPQQQYRARIIALESAVHELKNTAGAQAFVPVPPPLSGDTGTIDEIIARLDTLETFERRASDADAGLAARISQLSSQLQGFVNDSTLANRQARELLTLAAARRFVETGRPLGWIGDAIISEFTASDQTVIDAVTNWSAAPQSRILLQRKLAELAAPAPSTAPAHTAGNWWDRLRARLSAMVTVSPKAVIETQPAELAQAALDNDDIALAITQMETAPPSPQRNAWLADARRLAAIVAALDMLEGRVLSAAARAPDATPAAPADSVPPPVNAPEAISELHADAP